MAASGNSIDSLEGAGAELGPGLDDRFIGNVDNGAAVVEVVAVVVTSMWTNWKWSRFWTDLSSSVVLMLRC
jgi:hypothetical protein